jgi:hypothetical protein
MSCQSPTILVGKPSMALFHSEENNWIWLCNMLRINVNIILKVHSFHFWSVSNLNCMKTKTKAFCWQMAEAKAIGLREQSPLG